MSALAPVLEPTPVLHSAAIPNPSADSLTPLESALTDCCLSYKQNASLSPLESALTDRPHLPDSAQFKTLSFDTLSDHSPVTPLESALTENRGEGVPPRRKSAPSCLRARRPLGAGGSRPATGNTVYADRGAASYSLDALYFAAGEILWPKPIYPPRWQLTRGAGRQNPRSPTATKSFVCWSKACETTPSLCSIPTALSSPGTQGRKRSRATPATKSSASTS